jgi:hypothetical protein
VRPQPESTYDRKTERWSVPVNLAVATDRQSPGVYQIGDV